MFVFICCHLRSSGVVEGRLAAGIVVGKKDWQEKYRIVQISNAFHAKAAKCEYAKGAKI